MLRARVAELTTQVTDLSAQVGSRDVKRVQERIEELRDPAGLTPREGEGLRITLSDSPLEADDTDQPTKWLIVHQQDIQAVVNAMWVEMQMDRSLEEGTAALLATLTA